MFYICFLLCCFLLFLYSTQKKVILFSLTRFTLFYFFSLCRKMLLLHCAFTCVILCVVLRIIALYTNYTQPERKQKSVISLQMKMCCICIDKVSVSWMDVCVRANSRMIFLLLFSNGRLYACVSCLWCVSECFWSYWIGFFLFRFKCASFGSSVYHSPDEKPPGGMRFLLMTWPLPFSDGMVVLISAAPPDL